MVCTGLFDDTRETPENYRDVLAAMRARSMFMVCANPDIVVERGDELVYCAGALADAYAAIGGKVLYCGKPHAPIYAAALGKAGVLRGGDPPIKRVLAIGDFDQDRSEGRGDRSASIACSSCPASMPRIPAAVRRRICRAWMRCSPAREFRRKL